MDVRLVPALAATYAVCLAVPVLPYDVALVLPWAVLGLAIAASTVLVATARTGRRAAATLAALAACALWIAAVAAVQASGDRVPVRASGWEGVVDAGRPVRLAGQASGTPTRSGGPFGESWHLVVAVERFGHPGRDAPAGTEVIVSGSGDWRHVRAGQPVCLTAVPEADATAVFARARTGPDAGSCPTPGAGADDGRGVPGTTGREVVRAAVRDTAAGSVGTAPQLLPGLVLGDRSLQEPELDEAMKTAGLSHLSAVSGDNFVKGYGRGSAVVRARRGGITPPLAVGPWGIRLMSAIHGGRAGS
ncbi:hypothetical protein E7744_06885 [Citricoccus sp. SGAir0253]|nr:hypothetical protein E7744_06885 [Citricoccus sp. SGAir0253]